MEIRRLRGMNHRNFSKLGGLGAWVLMLEWGAMSTDNFRSGLGIFADGPLDPFTPPRSKRQSRPRVMKRAWTARVPRVKGHFKRPRPDRGVRNRLRFRKPSSLDSGTCPL